MTWWGGLVSDEENVEDNIKRISKWRDEEFRLNAKLFCPETE